MDLKQVIKTYIDYRTKMQALGYASYIISWDSETEAPVGCFEERSKQIGVLSEMSYSLERSEEYIDAVKYLFENLENLDELLKIEIKKVYKDLMNSLKVPMEELVEYSILLSKSQNVWADAKVTNDYKQFFELLRQLYEKQIELYFSRFFLFHQLKQCLPARRSRKSHLMGLLLYVRCSF